MKCNLSLLMKVLLFTLIFQLAKSPKSVAQSTVDLDVIPDAVTAKKVAEAIFISRFGKKRIARRKPLVVSLRGDSVWIVHGTLPKGMRGGTAYIELRKRDCLVLELKHGK